MPSFFIPKQVEMTYISSVVSVSNVSTLVLNANQNRRYLHIRRGTTVGRVFVLLGSGTATVTNGILMRENQFMEDDPSSYYTGEVNAIAVGSSKILYVTEGFIV